MVRQCSIKTCKSASFAGCGVSFHRLPAQEVLKQKWLDAIANCLRNVRMPVVCSVHFRPEDYYQGRFRLKKLKEDAVPSLFSVSPNTEHKTPLLVKIEAEEETQLDNVPITVRSGPSAKTPVQRSDPTPAVLGPMIVEVKAETDGNPPSVEQALSFDEDGPLEDLVPLSAHPVPLSTAPDPLCDVKVKVEAVNEAEGDGTGVEEDRRVMPSGGLRDGILLRGVPPPTADLLHTRKLQQTILNLTRRSERERARGRDALNILRRRDMQVTCLRGRLCGAGGGGTGGAGTGGGQGDGLNEKMYRSMIRRRDAKISALQTELHSLRAQREGLQGACDAPRTQIYSIKKDERMKKANRQLLIIERDDRQKSSDIGQQSVEIPSNNRKKLSFQSKTEILQGSLVNVGNTSVIRKKPLVDTKPTLVIERKNPVSVVHTQRKSFKKTPKNTFVVMQPIMDIAENSSFGTATTLGVRQNSSVVKAKSVVQQIGSKHKSDTRRIIEKRRVIFQTKSDARQTKSPNYPQTSVGLQRTSDIRQNTLVIQIDGMQSTVIPPKLVRLEDNNMMDMG